MRALRLTLCAVLLLTVSPVFSQSESRPQKSPSGHPAKPGTATNPMGDFDAYVARTMKEWKVPGVAIAVVQDGKVILSRGYGLRDTKNNLPVTTKTIFPIASITKSFTVATLATLSTEGKLDWDKPVRDSLPDFRLEDDFLTARVTTRDLVTHRTGLPKHDASWYHTDTPRAELVHSLRYLERSKDLRQTFQYNNLMFVTAGYLAGQLNGSSWEDAVRQRLFGPLGMASSNFSRTDSQKSPDYAHAYQKDDNEEVHEVHILQADNMGPAGGINSNLEDMTQYLLLYLDRGKHGDRQIISPADIRQMTTPQMVVPTAGIDRELGFLNYGMGLFVTSYRGHRFVQHSGNLDGFSLLLSFLPDDNVGVVVLTNLDDTGLIEVLTYNVYDRLLGMEQADWNTRLMKGYLESKKAEDEATKKNYIPRRESTSPSHPIGEYVGEYRHPAYGVVAVERAEGNDLKISWHGFTSTAKHWHYDVWRVPQNALDRLERRQLMFLADWNGDITQLASPLEPQVKDILFDRLPDRRMRERSFLEPLAGVYALGDFKFTVTLRADNTLTLTTPAGAVRELEPVRGTTFNVKTQPGSSLSFKLDAAGKVSEAALTQPGSTVVLKRQP